MRCAPSSIVPTTRFLFPHEPTSGPTPLKPCLKGGEIRISTENPTFKLYFPTTRKDLSEAAPPETPILYPGSHPL